MLYILSELVQNVAFQLILISSIGALLGEATKEINDEETIKASKFLIESLGSAFMGVIIGLIIKACKDNDNLIFGVTGAASFAGYKKSSDIYTMITEKIISK